MTKSEMFKKYWGKFMLLLSQIKLNLTYLVKRATIWTSSTIALFQILGFLCEFNDIFPNTWTFLTRLLVSIIAVTIIWFAAFLINIYLVFKNHRVSVIDAENGHRVYVEYGDLFEDSVEKRNVVVTVNRCFDTLVDNDLISETTIHGMAINKLCKDGYTTDMLNDALQLDLSQNRQSIPCCTLSIKDKRKGNLQRYPEGTVAEFRKTPTDGTTYFFVGMSAFNSQLHPETSDKEYVDTFQSLIEYCNLRSQRLPIYMPIIGTHGRDNKKTERELLEYMISSLRFHKHLINTDIHIVVYYKRRHEVSIYGL